MVKNLSLLGSLLIALVNLTFLKRGNEFEMDDFKVLRGSYASLSAEWIKIWILKENIGCLKVSQTFVVLVYSSESLCQFLQFHSDIKC